MNLTRRDWLTLTGGAAFTDASGYGPPNCRRAS